MSKIVECVPNISEGIRKEIYLTIAKSCEKIPGITLLDVDPGKTTNRTVITFAGSPDVIVDGAFEVIKASKELIDMRIHKGEHPRMGATDVCPFVPVSGVTLEECSILARKLAERVGKELKVWTYLYESAALKPEWKNLSYVRKGEYEKLRDREGRTEWKPDFGPEALDLKFGAVAIGARKVLVAYNINLNSKNLKLATDIASNIRESGRAKRTFYPDGDIERNADGSAIMIPGVFSHVKGGAWVIPEYGRAQITLNLTDTDETPIHAVFDEVCRQASERGMRVTGSEIVGLVPLKAIRDAALHYAKKQKLSYALSENELINIASLSLGLSDVSSFIPDEKIIEYRLQKKGVLAEMTLTRFTDTLASDEPAPGGGSVSALSGAMAAALGTMVTNLTHGKRGYEACQEEMERLGSAGQLLKTWFLDAVDRDTEAFNAVMEAFRLPKETDLQMEVRKKAIHDTNRQCTEVPLSVLEETLKILPILEACARNGNPNCLSDIGVGLHCLRTCAEGAALNVRINLKGQKESDFVNECRIRMDRALEEIRRRSASILSVIDEKL